MSDSTTITAPEAHAEGYRLGIAHATNALNNKHRTSILNTLRSEVSEGNMERTHAQSIYDTLAEANEWAPATISTQFTVTVSIFGNPVFDTIVEADSEEQARELASDAFEVEDFEANFTISTIGGSTSLFSSGYEYDWEEVIYSNVEFEAEVIE